MPTVNPGETVPVDDLEALPSAGTQELTLVELYDKICEEEDIFIVIDAIEESRIRKGLSSVKAKRNSKLKESDLPIDDSVLEFKKHEDEELAKVNRVRLQIYIKRKPTITIHKLDVATGEL